MPAHKSKNFRFRIIDDCLRDKSRKWSLDDLIKEVSRRLSDEFNVEQVSRRSIQYDIALMREPQPIGYNAPIICIDGCYSYSDENFSIQNMQLSKPDIDNLTEVINTLKQYKQYTHLGDITKLIEKIEAIITVNPKPNSPIAEFEIGKTLEKGITWLKQIVDATEKKQVIEVSQKRNNAVVQIIFHPYYLKEYHNEWFLYGIEDKSEKFTMIPVSEILAISPQIVDFIENTKYHVDDYFKYLVGVTPSESAKPVQVRLKITSDIIETVKKHPFHHTQIVEDCMDGAIVDMKVMINKDLSEKILRYGSKVKVELPDKFRKAIADEHKKSGETTVQLSLF